jgi:hypothetical protein
MGNTCYKVFVGTDKEVHMCTLVNMHDEYTITDTIINFPNCKQYPHQHYCKTHFMAELAIQVPPELPTGTKLKRGRKNGNNKSAV